MRTKLKGVGVALVTPFDKDGTVDFNGIDRLVNHVIDGGVDYLVVLGTTGEAATCSTEEKAAILSRVIQVNQGRKPIVFGIGGNNTQDVLDTLSSVDLTGVDAILSASPYYNKPTQEGIYQHYKAIADKSPVPVVLYNVPGRTASNVSAETTLKLAGHQNICAIKEASGDLEQCMEIMRDKPDDFMLISGDDLLTTSMISFGAEGVISVLANAIPDRFSSIIKNALNGDYNLAATHLFGILRLNTLMYTESNPVGVKIALELSGIIDGQVRLPLLRGSEELKLAIKKEL